MAISFLMLGSNLGDRRRNLEEARSLISKMVGRLGLFSSVYETEPWGFTDENLFFNQAVEVSTSLVPTELLKEINKIEAMLGRKRSNERYAARTMDIDILFYNNLIMNTSLLTIPHPEMIKRRFVLEPLAEIAPELIHPVYNKTVGSLLQECKDRCKVYVIN